MRILSLRRADALLLLALCLAGLASMLWDGANAVFSSLQLIFQACLGLFCLAILLDIRRRQDDALGGRVQHTQESTQTFRQLEGLMGLYSCLTPAIPFPPTRGAAGSPDFLVAIVHVIGRTRPALVIETGSGVSTLICAYALRRLGIRGRLLSLEHDLNYAAQTRQNLADHGLSDLACVIHAPLISIDGSPRLWYDVSALPVDTKVDLLIVDGPPAYIQEDIRSSTVPVMLGKLKPGGIILLDDANRPAEKAMIQEWLREFPQLTCTRIPSEKGLVTLTVAGEAIT